MITAFIFLAATQSQGPSQIVLPKDPYDIPARVALQRHMVKSAIKVVYYRPSSMLKMLNVQGPVEVSADDRAGVLIVSGFPRQVDDVRAQLQTEDVPRRTVQLHVLVTSPSSSFRFEGDVKLLTNQTWTTIDSDTDATICLQATASGKDAVALFASVSWKVPAEGSAGVRSIVRSTGTAVRSGQTWTMPKSADENGPDLKVEITPTVLDIQPPPPIEYH